MKLKFIKQILFFLAITITVFLFFSSRYLESKIEDEKSINKLNNKIYPTELIFDLNGNRLNSVASMDKKMIIHLSTNCPHCLTLVKALNNTNKYNITDNIFPVYKVSTNQIDSFQKINNLSNIKLFHIADTEINQEIKSVPTFIVLDKENKIERTFSGLPQSIKSDSIINYVKSMFFDKNLFKDIPIESCDK